MSVAEEERESRALAASVASAAARKAPVPQRTVPSSLAHLQRDLYEAEREDMSAPASRMSHRSDERAEEEVGSRGESRPSSGGRGDNGGSGGKSNPNVRSKDESDDDDDDPQTGPKEESKWHRASVIDTRRIPGRVVLNDTEDAGAKPRLQNDMEQRKQEQQQRLERDGSRSALDRDDSRPGSSLSENRGMNPMRSNSSLDRNNTENGGAARGMVPKLDTPATPGTTFTRHFRKFCISHLIFYLFFPSYPLLFVYSHAGNGRDRPMSHRSRLEEAKEFSKRFAQVHCKIGYQFTRLSIHYIDVMLWCRF